MGGGYSIDQMLRIPGRSWWPEEMPSDPLVRNGQVDLFYRPTQALTSLVGVETPPFISPLGGEPSLST